MSSLIEESNGPGGSVLTEGSNGPGGGTRCEVRGTVADNYY